MFRVWILIHASTGADGKTRRHTIRAGPASSRPWGGRSGGDSRRRLPGGRGARLTCSAATGLAPFFPSLILLAGNSSGSPDFTCLPARGLPADPSARARPARPMPTVPAAAPCYRAPPGSTGSRTWRGPPRRSPPRLDERFRDNWASSTQECVPSWKDFLCCGDPHFGFLRLRVRRAGERLVRSHEWEERRPPP